MTEAGRVHGRNYDFRAGWEWRMKTRPAVLRRDGYRCHYCGGRADQVDHRVRVQDGGSRHDMANLVAACGRCNAARSHGPVASDRPTVFSRRLQHPLSVVSLSLPNLGRAPLTGDYSRRTQDAGDGDR